MVKNQKLIKKPKKTETKQKKSQKEIKITLKTESGETKTQKLKKKVKKNELIPSNQNYKINYIKNSINGLLFFFLLKNKKYIITCSNNYISTYIPETMKLISKKTLNLYLSHLLELSDGKLVAVSKLKIIYYNILNNGIIQIISEMPFVIPHNCIGVFQINNNSIIVGREGKIHIYDFNSQITKKTIMILNIGKYKKSKFSLNENSSIKSFFYERDSNNIVLISNICLYFMNIENNKIYSRLSYGNEFRKYVDLGYQNKNKLCIFTQSNIRIYNFDEGKEIFKFVPDYAISIVVKGKNVNEIISGQKNGFICIYDIEKGIQNKIFQISKCVINFIFYVNDYNCISNAEKNNFILYNLNDGKVNEKINIDNSKDYRKMITLDNGDLIFRSTQNFVILSKNK